ncbi:hypothetical protein AHAS_Ahas04G0140000 [Arachis hypogaea]
MSSFTLLFPKSPFPPKIPISSIGCTKLPRLYRSPIRRRSATLLSPLCCASFPSLPPFLVVVPKDSERGVHFRTIGSFICAMMIGTLGQNLRIGLGSEQKGSCCKLLVRHMLRLLLKSYFITYF